MNETERKAPAPVQIHSSGTTGKNPANKHSRCQQHEEKQSQQGGQRLTGKGVVPYLGIMRREAHPWPGQRVVHADG